MKLSIVIIKYNCQNEIVRCIESIQTSYLHEIIVVDHDNAPMPPLSKKINYLPFLSNGGFSAGNNRGFKVATGEYLMTLNADLFLTPDYIDRCIEYMESDLACASIQGKLLKERDHQFIDSTGNCLTTSMMAYNENHLYRDTYIKSHSIFGVCAAAAIFRKSALFDIMVNDQIFDEDFFAYLEDVDLNIRLLNKGYVAYYLETAVAFHIREASTGFFSRLNHSLTNRLLLLCKHASSVQLYVNLVLWIPYILLFMPKRFSRIKLIKKKMSLREKHAISFLYLKKCVNSFEFFSFLLKRIVNGK